jgi:hypothetical protein
LPLDLNKASSILTSEGIFWEALNQDLSDNKGNPLSVIRDSKSKFIQSRELVDRDEVKEQLNDIISSINGKFVLYLGGVTYQFSLSSSLRQEHWKESHNTIFTRWF